MAAPQSSEDIETAPPPAVSSLRSRFEKLATGSPASANASLKPSPAPAHSFLAPCSIPSSPRLRPTPTPEHDRDFSEQRAQFLHPSTSASDPRTVGKRPPPPPPSSLRPPSRTPSPAPSRSPLLRPISPAVSDSDGPQDTPLTPSKVAALARRPPPPPPLSQDHSGHRAAPVSSLVKQFGYVLPISFSFITFFRFLQIPGIRWSRITALHPSSRSVVPPLNSMLRGVHTSL